MRPRGGRCWRRPSSTRCRSGSLPGGRWGFGVPPVRCTLPMGEDWRRGVACLACLAARRRASASFLRRLRAASGSRSGRIREVSHSQLRNRGFPGAPGRGRWREAGSISTAVMALSSPTTGRGTSVRCRRNRLRSLAVKPPQIPSSSGQARAYSAQSSWCSQALQIFLAGPADLPTGWKNTFGSVSRQAAWGKRGGAGPGSSIRRASWFVPAAAGVDGPAQSDVAGDHVGWLAPLGRRVRIEGIPVVGHGSFSLLAAYGVTGSHGTPEAVHSARSVIGTTTMVSCPSASATRNGSASGSLSAGWATVTTRNRTRSCGLARFQL